MASVVYDLVEPPEVAQALRFNLFLNATRRAKWFDGIVPLRPPVEPPVPAGGPDQVQTR
ncbi:hypothetical protein [Primorskyibacter sp. 2E233]|uniref:hypothetical protein n=1 Tax=Primorskyibacter sp. 2E233 TaxID=3413431 RepID=UPI003BF0308A